MGVNEDGRDEESLAVLFGYEPAHSWRLADSKRFIVAFV